MTEAGLVPGMSGAEFLQYIPSVEKLCQVDCLQVCNIDSTNMTPSHWLAIAQAVETHYETYDGFVICHGTDTLAYTAAALSYLIQDSPKPIVLTGSQKPVSYTHLCGRCWRRTPTGWPVKSFSRKTATTCAAGPRWPLA